MEQPYGREVVVRLFDLLERAMGIGPTSEAWEACFMALKAHKLAAIDVLRNSQMDSNWSSGGRFAVG